METTLRFIASAAAAGISLGLALDLRTAALAYLAAAILLFPRTHGHT
ncbi:hypothetical protein AB0L80_31850 [Streptomyces sp. NPDC052069]